MAPEASRSPTRSRTCTAAPMHPGLRRHERPEVEVVFHANPCEAKTCIGKLICIGHGVCTTCAIEIRANKCIWGTQGTDIDLYWMHS